MEKSNEYSIYILIEINFGDPISAMLLTQDHLIIGTMFGQIILFTFQTKNISILSEFNQENISNISYNSDDNIINISIGDEKILRYKEDKNNPDNYNLFQKVLNYSNEIDHIKYCENAFIYLSSNYLFRIQLTQPEEKCLNILEIESEYEIMNINNNDVFHIGRLPMTNYIVPFCFDGENFAWVEFTGPDKRNVCLANVINSFIQKNHTTNNDNAYKKSIDDDFGHISHLKILDKNKIFLVRSLNICEIRQLNNDFTLLESFEHNGDEVYAIDIYFHNECLRYKDNEKESSNINFLLDDKNNLNKQINLNNDNNISQINDEGKSNNNIFINGKMNDETVSKKENENENDIDDDNDNELNNENRLIEKSKTEHISQKIRQSNKQNNNDKINILIDNLMNVNDNSENNKKSIANNFENNENKKNVNFKNYHCDSDIDLSYSIISLDIDGNVNLYQYGKENTLFNLYDFKEIPQKMKNDKFFAMGYEYYIKSNLNYFCISTDQGCFVIKKNTQFFKSNDKS